MALDRLTAVAEDRISAALPPGLWVRCERNQLTIYGRAARTRMLEDDLWDVIKPTLAQR